MILDYLSSFSLGLHCTSGAQAYVQCTSPIRRYYDLLNHYNLKAAMHAATVPPAGTAAPAPAREAVSVAVEGALPVATRLQTLSAVKMVKLLICYPLHLPLSPPHLHFYPDLFYSSHSLLTIFNGARKFLTASFLFCSLLHNFMISYQIQSFLF